MPAKREMHGLSHVNGKRTPLHRLWLAIRVRCNHPGHPDYKYYGGRGIKVCKRWDRFVNFVADVGPHPGKGWTLDRTNNNGDYKPSNVRWATRKTQVRNRNYVRLDEATVRAIRRAYAAPRHPSQTILAARYGVSQTTISQIVRGYRMKAGTKQGAWQ